MPKNVGDLGKLIVAKCLKNCPKSNKLPNLVTLELKDTIKYLPFITHCLEDFLPVDDDIKLFLEEIWKI